MMKRNSTKQTVLLLSLIAILSLAGLAGCSDADNTLTTGVNNVLADHTDVKASFNNKEVTLTGKVSSDAERTKVASLVRGVPGVNSVKNNMTVTAGPAPVKNFIDDTVITTMIKGKHLAQEGLESLDIGVKTVEGVVTLSGTATNTSQISLAEKVANEVDGVKKVISNLTVKR